MHAYNIIQAMALSCLQERPLPRRAQHSKARGLRGLRYVHMNTPCPAGWGFDPKDDGSWRVIYAKAPGEAPQGDRILVEWGLGTFAELPAGDRGA